MSLLRQPLLPSKITLRCPHLLNKDSIDPVKSAAFYWERNNCPNTRNQFANSFDDFAWVFAKGSISFTRLYF